MELFRTATGYIVLKVSHPEYEEGFYKLWDGEFFAPLGDRPNWEQIGTLENPPTPESLIEGTGLTQQWVDSFGERIAYWREKLNP